MSHIHKEVGIQRGNFGATYQFVVKNVNYSSYTPRLYVQSSGGTVLISGSLCTAVATDGNKNTLVSYTPRSGAFGVTASIGDYIANITFSGANFRDSTYPFNWQVYDELRGGRYIP